MRIELAAIVAGLAWLGIMTCVNAMSVEMVTIVAGFVWLALLHCRQTKRVIRSIEALGKAFEHPRDSVRTTAIDAAPRRTPEADGTPS